MAFEWVGLSSWVVGTLMGGGLVHWWHQSRQKADGSIKELLSPLLQQTQQQQHQISQQLQQNQHLLSEQLRNQAHNTQTVLQTQLHQLTETTDQRLSRLQAQLYDKLSEASNTQNTVLQDIVKRLALIDKAQATMTKLSEDMLGLKAILSNKQSRGAFGEWQLETIVTDILPAHCYERQKTLPNAMRADLVLLLPEPTGWLVIDSKFPYENYARITESESTAQQVQAFKQDIKKHIKDIASKYIISQITADSAVMFIPSESIFAEIHAKHPDLVKLAHQQKVWLASPTTLMAIVTTAAAVFKDHATQQQVGLIQTHLKHLSDDFLRFDKRISQLAKHIGQAHQDVNQVKTSADKISQRFKKIESAQLDTIDEAAPLSIEPIIE